RLPFEELGDVVEHEPLALAVLQRSAVPAHALGDEDAAHRRWPHHPRRMELHELHVDQVAPAQSASQWPSPRYSQEVDVTFHALPMPPVARTTAFALKRTTRPDSRQYPMAPHTRSPSLNRRVIVHSM